MSQRNPDVDAYVRKAAAFARPIIERLRDMVHAACPEVEECIKWSCPFFVYRGPLCAVAAFNAHCRIGFWKADLLRKGPAAAALAGLDRVTTPAPGRRGTPSRPAIAGITWSRSPRRRRTRPATAGCSRRVEWLVEGKSRNWKYQARAK